MSDSTRIDINYISVTPGPTFTKDAGGTDAQQVPWPGDNMHPETDQYSYASILKVGDYGFIRSGPLIVPQGAECALDLNNNATAAISGELGTTGNTTGDQIVSVKGGSHLTFSGILRGHGYRQGADVVVDEWSDQSYDGSCVDLTQARHESGDKIKVVKRYFASEVTGDVDILIWESVKLTAYWWTKRVVRAIMGIKQGQKGPSWL